MRCDEVAEALIAQGLHAAALHGGRSQSEREAALRDFRNGSTKILVILTSLLGRIFMESPTRWDHLLRCWESFELRSCETFLVHSSSRYLVETWFYIFLVIIHLHLCMQCKI